MSCYLLKIFSFRVKNFLFRHRPTTAKVVVKMEAAAEAAAAPAAAPAAAGSVSESNLLDPE